MAFTILGIALNYIKSILEVMLYMSAIFVSYKAVQALNIYINKIQDKILGYMVDMVILLNNKSEIAIFYILLMKPFVYFIV